MKKTKKTKISIYKQVAFAWMVLYIIFVLFITLNTMSELPDKNLLLAFSYVVSSSAPVFVSLESMIFAAHGVKEFSKLKTSLLSTDISA